MITRHARGKITWVDLESPTREELSEVMREFDINSRVEDEISGATPYPVVLSSPKYVYMVLHFPTTDPEGGTKSQEVDFIVGKTFLITARYEIIHTIHNLHKVFEAEELLGLHGNVQGAEMLLERVLRRMYTAIREEMETMNESLDRIERDIFGGKEKQAVRLISETNRVLLRFDNTLKRHAESLPLFLSELSTPTFFGKKFQQHAIHIEAEHDHIAALVSSYRDIAAELRDTNDSLLSASQNEVMKTLTVITFTILPLSLIAAIFQMNVDTPLQNNPNNFWYVLAGMICVSGLLVFYAKRKKWL